MGFRFRKSKKILPGVRVNFSKKGAGVRLGGKHGGVSFGPSGSRVSASIPGTGISYSTKLGGSKKSKSRSSAQKRTARPVNHRPVSLRWWYLLLIVLVFVGGFENFGENIGAALFGIIVGLIMSAFTVITVLRKLKADESES